METGENNASTTIEAKSFSSTLTEEYHLAIELGTNHFCYAITDRKSLTCQYFKQYNFSNAAEEIPALINSDQLIKANFLSQSIAFVNFPSTLVPSSIYKAENNKKLLEMNSSVFSNILVDTLKTHQAKLIYSLPKEIKDIADTYFPKAKQYSQETILLKHYSKLDNTTEKAYLYVSKGRFNISVFRSNKLIFNNSFEYDTKEDLLYFTLFSFEQLRLNPEQITTTVFGSVKRYSELYIILYDYIRNIETGTQDERLNFPLEFKNLSNQKHLGLFSQILCE